MLYNLPRNQIIIGVVFGYLFPTPATMGAVSCIPSTPTTTKTADSNLTSTKITVSSVGAFHSDYSHVFLQYDCLPLTPTKIRAVTST